MEAGAAFGEVRARAALTGNLKLVPPQAVKHLERVFGVDSQTVKDIKGTEKKYTKTKFGLALNRIKEVYHLDAAVVQDADLPVHLTTRGLVPLTQYAVKPVQACRSKGMIPWPVKIEGYEPFTIEEEDQRGGRSLRQPGVPRSRRLENPP